MYFSESFSPTGSAMLQYGVQRSNLTRLWGSMWEQEREWKNAAGSGGTLSSTIRPFVTSTIYIESGFIDRRLTIIPIVSLNNLFHCGPETTPLCGQWPGQR